LNISGHHTKNIDENKDTYEDILRKTRDESLGERVRGRILVGNYYLLEEYVFFFLFILKNWIIFNIIEIMINILFKVNEYDVVL
jgi:uncharacterized membrane protein